MPPPPVTPMKKGKTTKVIDTANFIQNPWARSLYSLVRPSLENVFGIRKLNKLYSGCAHGQDPGEFSACVLQSLKVKYHLRPSDLERLRSVQGPLVIVSNHPFGGLEALLLFVLMRSIRPDFRIMANYMLKVAELEPSFIFVDPFEEAKSRTYNLRPLKEALGYLKQGGFLGVFPSGEVASLNRKTRKIQEPAWNSNIAKLIQKTGATVVPLYFHGYNSALFQLASLINPKVRTSLLIREFVNPKRRKLHYQLGSLISPEKIATFGDAEVLTAYLKSKTYILGTRYRRSKFKFDLIRALQPPDNQQPEEVVLPVDKALLAADVAAFTPENHLFTQKEFDVLVFTAAQAPNLLQEVGRLREITFRAVGEGTLKRIDLDKFDQWYSHIIIWNREKTEIVGAYRVGKCDQILEQRGQAGLYNNTLFHIQPQLYRQINPALELGRSWVRQEYQRSYSPLLLLWTGIGHFICREPKYHSLIGPVSITADFHTTSKDLLVKFLQENSFNKELKEFVRARNPYPDVKAHHVPFYNSFSIRNLNDVQDLITEVESTNMKVPILIKHYLKMGGNIIAFNLDPEFSDVLDGLMYIDLRRTDPAILNKYMGAAGLKLFAQLHGIALPPRLAQPATEA